MGLEFAVHWGPLQISRIEDGGGMAETREKQKQQVSALRAWRVGGLAEKQKLVLREFAFVVVEWTKSNNKNNRRSFDFVSRMARNFAQDDTVW
jgi:hypothetical protein